MPLGNPQTGFQHSAEYQSSAIPWVTSSCVAPASTSPAACYEFPMVSKTITVINNGPGYLDLGFTQNGMRFGNSVSLPPSSSLWVDWRVTKVYVRGNTPTQPIFSLAVGLTTIPAGMMPLLSGTLPDGTPGWSGVG